MLPELTKYASAGGVDIRMMEAVIWRRVRSYSGRFSQGEGIEGEIFVQAQLLWRPGAFPAGPTPLSSPVAAMIPASAISDDAAIIHDVLRGHVNSFELLLDRYQDHVSKIVRSHVPWDDAPEVAHETFVRAFQSLGGFRGIRPFKHWLAKIAVRCCHDFWRGYYQKKEHQVGGLPDDCQAWVDEVLVGPIPGRGHGEDGGQGFAPVGLGAVVARMTGWF